MEKLLIACCEAGKSINLWKLRNISRHSSLAFVLFDLNLNWRLEHNTETVCGIQQYLISITADDDFGAAAVRLLFLVLNFAILRLYWEEKFFRCRVTTKSRNVWRRVWMFMWAQSYWVCEVRKWRWDWREIKSSHFPHHIYSVLNTIFHTKSIELSLEREKHIRCLRKKLTCKTIWKMS